MALVECIDCGKQISDRAKACTGCGGPVDWMETTKHTNENYSDQKYNLANVNPDVSMHRTEQFHQSDTFTEQIENPPILRASRDLDRQKEKPALNSKKRVSAKKTLIKILALAIIMMTTIYIFPKVL